GMVAPLLRQRQEAHGDMAAGDAPLRLERHAAQCLDGEVEGAALVAQRRDGAFERAGAARRQPSAEGEERRPVVRYARLVQRADEVGLAAVAGPYEGALVAQVEQRLGALERGVQLGDAAAELDVLGRSAAALADQED